MGTLYYLYPRDYTHTRQTKCEGLTDVDRQKFRNWTSNRLGPCMFPRSNIGVGAKISQMDRNIPGGATATGDALRWAGFLV